MFIISNVEPFETERDALVAAEKLGDEFEVYDIGEDDENSFIEDEDEEEDDEEED